MLGVCQVGVTGGRSVQKPDRVVKWTDADVQTTT
jgi:hypothetical protein